jgi:hypothetical protein
LETWLCAVGWRYFTLARLANGRAIILAYGRQVVDMALVAAISRQMT